MEVVRILQMIGSLDVGGSQAMIINLYKGIDRDKVQFDFVLDEPTGIHYVDLVKSMGARVYVLPKFNGFNAKQVKRSWKRFLSEHLEYKILHSHVRSYASLYLPIAQKFGLVTITHSHSTSNGSGLKSVVKKILQSSIPKYSNYCFACTEKSGKWLFGKKVVNSDKFKIIPNAIDANKYKFNLSIREKVRKELGIEDKLVYGHIGRFHPAKNHHFLLELFAKIRSKQPESVLLLVGDGELRCDIEKKISELSLNDCVIMLGVRSDVNVLLQAMDVFLFPSLWEGLPLTVVEAQAAGLPCFVSNTVTREVELSELVQYFPVDNGVEVWLKALESKTFERKDVMNKIIESGFDIKASVEKLTEFYMEQING